MPANTNHIKKQFTLGKQERLKSRKLIELLFKQSKSFSIYPFRVQFLFNLPQEQPGAVLQAGFSASSRHFKKAVDRNRIKRLSREAYRLQKNELQQLLHEKNKQLVVFFIYTGKELPAYEMAYSKLGLCLNKLNEITTAM